MLWCMLRSKKFIMFFFSRLMQGHAFNTFPKMGDTWIPGDIFDLKPVIRNFFENTSTVQVICLYKFSILES